MKKIFFILLCSYIALMLFAYLFSDIFTFFPPPSTYKNFPGIIKLQTKNDETISAIYVPNKKAKYLLLLSHGNAEDLGKIAPVIQKFHDIGLAVFAYDYQGYGTSTGKPSVKHAYYDVNAAYQYVTQKLGFKSSQIIAYGRSVGTALAIDLAYRKPIGGLIIQSPFVTAFRAMTQIPILPFDKFNNLKKIKQIHCPILVIHGTEDGIIPFWQGKRIYKEANPPKQYLWIIGSGHNNVIKKAGSAYWKSVSDFINTYIKKHNN